MKTTIDDVKIARVFKEEYKCNERVETLARLVTLTREVYAYDAKAVAVEVRSRLRAGKTSRRRRGAS